MAYTIQKGDTLWGIAKKNNTTVEELARVNGISNPNRIYAGQTLNLGGSSQSSPQPNNTANVPSVNYRSEYSQSDNVNNKQNALNGLNDKLNNYGDFQSDFKSQLDDIYNKIMNREKFTFDLNSDAMYQSAKEQYTHLGKMAMMDTMGQASAMTGGYGNSYASTAGNQAYQQHLTGLNDIIPELYQAALNKYQIEGSDMMNQASLVKSRYDDDYSKWNDDYNKLVGERDYASDDYNNERNFDYGKYSDDRTYGENRRQYEENLAYQKERDRVEDERWAKEYALSQMKARSSGKKDEPKPPKITGDIIAKCEEYLGDSKGLANYLDSLTDGGLLSDEDADKLYTRFKASDSESGNFSNFGRNTNINNVLNKVGIR